MNTREILKEIKINDKCRDFKWINEKFEQGNLYLHGSKLTKGAFDKFRLAVKAAQDVHTDNWDLDISVPTGTSLENCTVDIRGLVIYFKEVTIVNSYKKKHVINDLFVSIDLYRDNSQIKIYNLSGGRTTVSYAEWNSNYFHSHLSGFIGKNGSSDVPPYWSSFCRGSGHINDFIAEINSDGFTSEKFELFLVQLLGMISWESLEGGPYKTISSIKTSPSSGRIYNYSVQRAKWYLNKLIEHHKIDNKTPDINVKYESEKYSISDDEKFDVFINSYISLLTESDKTRVLCMESDGIYYAYGQLPGYRTPPSIGLKYIFQGQEVPVVIGNPPELEDISKQSYILHPSIKTFIKEQLEYDINIKKIRESTIARYENKDGHAQESARPDTVAVQGDI